MNTALKTLPVLFLAALLAACGGGGDGGTEPAASTPPTPDQLLGQLRIVEFYGERLAPEVTTAWGALAFDGLGTLVGGGVAYNKAGLTDVTAYGPFTYEIGEGNRLTWSIDDDVAAVGGVTADGDAALLGRIRDGRNPGLHVLVRPAGPYGLTSLDGAYHLGGLIHGEPRQGALWGTVTFDRDGGLTSSHGANVEGNAEGLFDSLGDYTVSSEGALNCLLLGQRYEGAILAGGDVLILAGGTQDLDLQGLFVLVRTGAAPDESLLSGPYHYVRMRGDWDDAGPVWTVETGTATSDGAGVVTRADAWRSEDGVVSPVTGGALINYEVQSDGGLKAQADGDPCQGGVSPDGRIAFLAGGTADGRDPQFWILLR